MLRKPGQLWILFGLCICLIFPAMIWLTVKTMRVDREFREDQQETELARREAEIQEKITSALYRMDWKLGPQIAREAARPYFLYQSFYATDNSPRIDAVLTQPKRKLPSPLLYETSEFVRLHFQIDPQDQISSPQRPQTKEYCEMAMTCCGVTDTVISEKDKQIKELKNFVSYKTLDNVMDTDQSSSDPDADGFLVGNSYLQPQAWNYVEKHGQAIANRDTPQQVISNPQLDQKSKVQRKRGNVRGGKEFVSRQRQYVDNTTQWVNNDLINLNEQIAASADVFPSRVIEGVMRPVWIGDELLLARRVKIQGQIVIQCCWLAWDKIQAALRNEVADILPSVAFEPIVNEEALLPERALVSLPVQLVVDTQPMLASSVIVSPKNLSQSHSGLQIALMVAWLALTISVLTTAILLRGVLQLSERRASFVSAVTHELRTPLTTFKMYSEMLAERMVPPEKQADYATTLHREADRLSHLVENVLQFARLERGSQKQRLTKYRIQDLLEGIPERLEARVKESGFELEYEVTEDVLNSQTFIEPHILDQVLFNLVDNACKYAAGSEKKLIMIAGSKTNNKLRFSVRDLGPGVASSDMARVFQPFHKSDLEAANSAPGVGLGLALCRRMLQSVGGRLYLGESKIGANFIVEIIAAK